MFALKVWVQNEVLTGKKDTGLQSYVLVYCSDRWSGKTDVARITQALTLKSVDGVGIAQVVELLTEKPGTILTVPSPRCGKGFFLPESTFSADSLTLSVQPPVCNRMHQRLCSR